MTTTTTTDHDAEALRMSARLDSATTLRVWTETPDALRRALRATSIDSAPYEGEAIHAALQMIGKGYDVGAAIGRAASTTATDAIRTAAQASVSLDVMLDTYGDVAERWSAYDDGAGIYRGVSRVAMPTDCLRADLPNPGTVADAAMSTLADPYRRALAACLAVNVAAESMRAEYVAQAKRDREHAERSSRGGQVKIITRALKSARDTFAKESVTRPRAQETTEALGLADTGRNRSATGEALTLANDAYWTARDGIVSDALKAHADTLTEQADRVREAYRLAGGHTMATTARENVAERMSWATGMDEPMATPVRTSAGRPRRMGTYDAVSSYGRPVNGSALAALKQADSRTTTDLPSSARHGERASDSPLSSTCGGAPTIG